MMYLHLQTTDHDYAIGLSHAIWLITSPQADQLVTQLYMQPVTSNTGLKALPIDEQAYRIDPEADWNLLLAMVHVSDEEREELIANLEASRGSSVTIASLLPESWQPALMTREQAQAQGWFTEGDE